MVKVAVMGHGVVGSGVVELLAAHKENIAKKVGEELEIAHILDLREFPGNPFEDKFTKDFNTILQDSEVKVVAEVMGGLHPAFEFVKSCLEAGKSVVTSNKELVAAKGAELLNIAREHQVNFMFEASVGGGIPIIRPMNQCLAANQVMRVAGILNGTTNFILTKMIEEQMSFDDALALAQKLGYAERNPAADIEGHDACRKICILAALAFGKHVYPEQVHTEGITQITLEDVAYAENWGGVIKLVGCAKPLPNGKIQAMVSPLFLSRDYLLSNVNDVFNAIEVYGDATGEVVFYGKGAGKMPTASAVVADMMDCAQNLTATKYIGWDNGVDEYVEDYLQTETAMYFRIQGNDSNTLQEAVEQVFPGCRYLSRNNQPKNEIALVAGKWKESALLQKKNALESQGLRVLNMIRIGEF